MKDIAITTVNTKGQLVIPKKMRDALKITPDVHLGISVSDQSIVIHPIEQVNPKGSQQSRLLKTLALTRGAWGEETEEEKKKEAARRKKELAASLKRKKAW